MIEVKTPDETPSVTIGRCEDGALLIEVPVGRVVLTRQLSARLGVPVAVSCNITNAIGILVEEFLSALWEADAPDVPTVEAPESLQPLLEISEWLSAALKQDGAEIGGSGMFLGTPLERDVDFEYRGQRYNFTLHRIAEEKGNDHTVSDR